MVQKVETELQEKLLVELPPEEKPERGSDDDGEGEGESSEPGKPRRVLISDFVVEKVSKFETKLDVDLEKMKKQIEEFEKSIIDHVEEELD